MLADASYDIWTEIKPSVMSAFGAVIDKAVFFGTDKPLTWPDAIVSTAIAKDKK